MSTNNKPYNTTAIIGNIKKIFKSGNIELLNKNSYNFLITHNYDIAHYNIDGFKGYYNGKVSQLAKAIIAQKSFVDSRYKDQWFKNAYGEVYEDSVYVIGIAIHNIASIEIETLQKDENTIRKVDELSAASKIAGKYGYTLTPIKEKPSQD